jgi:hypothetical protein
MIGEQSRFVIHELIPSFKRNGGNGIGPELIDIRGMAYILETVETLISNQ